MNTIVTGTEQAKARHTPALAALGVLVAVGVPMLIAIAGIATEGWGAISWAGALIWGIVATVAFMLVSMMGKAMGMTRMDLLDLLGSMFVEPKTNQSRMLGAAIHIGNGGLLGVAWVYGVIMIGAAANWWTGLIWGAALWVLALILMTSVGGIHPAIRGGKEEDPGTAATNFGTMTPVGSLVGHLVYGLVLGLLYQTWPLG